MLAIDADSLFYDVFSMPEKPKYRPGYGFQSTVIDYKKSHVPETIEEADIPKAVDSVKRRIDEMTERFFGLKTMIAVKGRYNFRDEVYPDYKSKRKAGKTILSALANLAIDEAIERGWAIPAHGMEAEDLARIWCVDAAKQKGPMIVIAHLDKDLNCMPGRHFNYRTNTMYDLTPKQAMHHFHYQLIVGDSTDSIPGAKGAGKVAAIKALAECETEADFQEAVVGVYMKQHPDDWYEMLMLNGKLIHILRTPTDVFNCDGWEVVQALR